MTELERYKEAVRVARDELHTIYSTAEVTDGKLTSACAEKAYDEINRILNPPPVYEEVTVERWECAKCGAVHKPEDHRDYCCNIPRSDGIPLTGTRRVQVAQKVERSVTVSARISEGGTPREIGGHSAMVIRFNPEFHNCTGKLTFTVEE